MTYYELVTAYKTGNVHLQEKNYRKAIVVLTQVINCHEEQLKKSLVDSLKANAYLDRSLAYLFQKNGSAATVDFDHAMSLYTNSEKVFAYRRRARVYIALGNFAAARDDIKTATELRGDIAAALEIMRHQHSKHVTFGGESVMKIKPENRRERSVHSSIRQEETCSLARSSTQSGSFSSFFAKDRSRKTDEVRAMKAMIQKVAKIPELVKTEYVQSKEFDEHQDKWFSI